MDTTPRTIQVPDNDDDHRDDVFTKALGAFEACLADPGNCSKRLALSAALEYLHRCAS